MRYVCVLDWRGEGKRQLFPFKKRLDGSKSCATLLYGGIIIIKHSGWWYHADDFKVVRNMADACSCHCSSCLLGVTLGIYWENGKEHGNYYLGFRASDAATSQSLLIQNAQCRQYLQMLRPNVGIIWVVIKNMVPFWVPSDNLEGHQDYGPFLGTLGSKKGP